MAEISKLEPKNNKRDRKATEDQIVAAFERVLLRDGMQGLGVNAVAQEAGVNKVLIYRYFQGLPGLARYWASHGNFWPSELELIGSDPEAFSELPVVERVCTVMCNYLYAIRKRPLTIQLLTGELQNETEITRAIADGLSIPGKGLADYVRLEEADEDIGEKVWRLVLIINALAVYLAVRERNSPNYHGMDLKDDDSWEYLRDTVREIVASYLKD